jgi:hypothetical protein
MPYLVKALEYGFPSGFGLTAGGNTPLLHDNINQLAGLKLSGKSCFFLEKNLNLTEKKVKDLNKII